MEIVCRHQYVIRWITKYHSITKFDRSEGTYLGHASYPKEIKKKDNVWSWRIFVDWGWEYSKCGASMPKRSAVVVSWFSIKIHILMFSDCIIRISPTLKDNYLLSIMFTHSTIINFCLLIVNSVIIIRYYYYLLKCNPLFYENSILRQVWIKWVCWVYYELKWYQVILLLTSFNYIS